jgi:hypothetical protein
MTELLKGFIKSIRQTNSGWLINDKVFIDTDGTLWNSFTNMTPYKDFPKYYFNLRDILIKRT